MGTDLVLPNLPHWAKAAQRELRDVIFLNEWGMA